MNQRQTVQPSSKEATTPPSRLRDMPSSTAPTGQVAAQWEDYDVLPILTSSLPNQTSIYHNLYLRRHNPEYTSTINASHDIDDRSLYALNVPIDATTTHFRSYFSSIGAGRVETVIFEDEPLPPRAVDVAGVQQPSSSSFATNKSKKRKRQTLENFDEKLPLPKTWDRKVHKSGASAVIVFVDAASLEMTIKIVKRQAATHLKKKRKSKELAFEEESHLWGNGITNGTIPSLGIERYKKHQSLIYPSPSVLQQLIDDSFTAYDARIEQETLARRRKAQEPDEDGFVTVVRSARPKPLLSAEEIAERQAMLKKQSEKGLYKDFYRFQQREVKKEQMQNLLSKFENDRRRVRGM